MFQKLGKNSFYKQETSSNMFTLDEITFYMSKYNSTGRKHVSTAGKHSSYRKKIYVFTSVKYVSTSGENTYYTWNYVLASSGIDKINRPFFFSRQDFISTNKHKKEYKALKAQLI